MHSRPASRVSPEGLEDIRSLFCRGMVLTRPSARAARGPGSGANAGRKVELARMGLNEPPVGWLARRRVRSRSEAARAGVRNLSGVLLLPSLEDVRREPRAETGRDTR